MKRRCFPLWLLRDIPAFVGVMATFWPMIISLYLAGREAARTGKFPTDLIDQLCSLLAHAEARLNHALWREAYRRVGWRGSDAPFAGIIPAQGYDAFKARCEAYIESFRNIDALVPAYADELRRRCNISRREAARAAHASTNTAPRTLAQQELVGVSTTEAKVALMVSSARSARPSNHERVLANARGPPQFPYCRLPIPHSLSAPARLRPHSHALTVKVSPPASAEWPRDHDGADVHPNSRERRAGGGRPCRKIALHRRQICERTNSEHEKPSRDTIYVDGGGEAGFACRVE